MSFDAILDQVTAVRALKSAIEKDRVAHAYLFIGPAGVGRKLAAAAFAKSLNCEESAGSTCCETCSNCRLIAEKKHPDVQTVMPTKRSSTITVRQIEDILPFAHMRPIKGRCKVFLICEADRLGMDAANKLLKTLEEPPPSTVFVLITERPQNMLPTVASRCQPIKFGRLRTDSVAGILVSDFHVTEDRAAIASELSDGQVTRGLEFADPDRMETVLGVIESLDSMPARVAAYDRLLGFFAERRDELQEEAEKSITDPGENLAPSIKASREDLRKSFVDRYYRDFLSDCLGLLLTLYRDAFVLKETSDEELVINRNKVELLRGCAGALSLSAIEQNMKEIERASEYCSHYVGEDRVFMDLLLKLRNE